MHVGLLIDGRVVWVKSHVLGKVGKATEKKKEANVERKMGRMELFVVAVSKVWVFPPVFKDSLSCVCDVWAVLAALVC